MGIRKFQLPLLTWNIYLGSVPPPLPILTPEQVTQVLNQFLATDFPDRAISLASVIASKNPDLIGLQEAVRWEINTPGSPSVIYDFIELLLAELNELGFKYDVAARNINRNLQNLPDSNGNTINFLDRDVILIRQDPRFTIINRQEANFQTNLPGFIRGWSLIDVDVEGHVFRMINTHLEPLSPDVRNAQALELVQVPANTILPVIITGDLNSTPDSIAYQILIDSGFQDVWIEVNEDSGLTCCQSPDLLNPISSLITRIDYILFKNGWNPIEAELVGEEQSNRTSTGLWPSDHAGISAILRLSDLS
jgi:endonuclease/exonuclease/phosphatase family metal-dependent hydrolase